MTEEKSDQFLKMLQAFNLVGGFLTIEQVEWFKVELFKELGLKLPQLAEVIELRPGKDDV
jgi:hypothetical protein